MEFGVCPQSLHRDGVVNEQIERQIIRNMTKEGIDAELARWATEEGHFQILYRVCLYCNVLYHSSA